MQKTNNQNPADSVNFSNLKRLAYFVAVVETGSFTAAAYRLGITKAVVSQQVARLEREFSTTLLTRTTRKVTLTDAGMSFYQRCARILKEAGDAFDELAEVAAEPRGTLRVTAPLDYGISALVPAIATFTREYPQCKVDAVFSDQSLNLVEKQVELAVRVGWLTDLTQQARQIGSFRQLLVAAPSWGQRLARVQQPSDIEDLPFVANHALREPLSWTFSGPQASTQSCCMHPVLSLDATLAVREAVRLGIGLSVLPDYAVDQDLRAGHLIHVLAQWQLPSGGIHVVYPATRFRPAKLRAFVDVLVMHEQSRQISTQQV